jgi:hypothetical protein
MFDQLPQLCIDLIGEKLIETSDIWTKEDVAHDLLVLMAVNKSCQTFAKDLVAKVDPPNDYDRLVVNWKAKKKPTKLMFSTALKQIDIKCSGKLSELKERLEEEQGRSHITGMSYAFTEHLESFHRIGYDEVWELCDTLGIYIDGYCLYYVKRLEGFHLGGGLIWRWELLGYVINKINTLENLAKEEEELKQEIHDKQQKRKLQIMEYLESKELELMDSMLNCHEYIENGGGIKRSQQEIDEIHFLCTHTKYMKCLSKWNYILQDSANEIDRFYRENHDGSSITILENMKETDNEIANERKYIQIKYETLQRYFRKCKNKHVVPHPTSIDIATRLKQNNKYDLYVNGKMRGI